MKEMGIFEGGVLLEKKKCWHDKARDLFYNKGLTLVEMGKIFNVTRKTISIFLQKEDPKAYRIEREKRKAETEERTKKAKKEYAENNPEKVRESQIKFNAKRLGITPEEYKNYLQEPKILRDELRQQQENDAFALSSHGLSKSISFSELSYYRSAYRQTRSGNLVRRDVTTCGATVPALGLPKSIRKQL